MFRAYSSFIGQEEKEHVVFWIKITDHLLTLCCGSCGRGLLARCTQVGDLIKVLDAEKLIADRGYDMNFIIEHVAKQGVEVVTLFKEKSKKDSVYDKRLHKLRYFFNYKIENVKKKKQIQQPLGRKLNKIFRNQPPFFSHIVDHELEVVD
jgi:hypothetical protein